MSSAWELVHWFRNNRYSVDPKTGKFMLLEENSPEWHKSRITVNAHAKTTSEISNGRCGELSYVNPDTGEIVRGIVKDFDDASKLLKRGFIPESYATRDNPVHQAHFQPISQPNKGHHHVR